MKLFNDFLQIPYDRDDFVETLCWPEAKFFLQFPYDRDKIVVDKLYWLEYKGSMLTIREHVLLALAGIWDVLDALPTRRDLPNMLDPSGWPQYKKKSLTATVYRMLSAGDIEKVQKGDKAFLRVTPQGLDRLKRDFPLAKWSNYSWDGKWRMVIFDVEEKQRQGRDMVRSKLKELGFGMLQRSVWISPFKIEEDLVAFFEHLGFGDEILVLVVDTLFSGDEQGLAERIWKLNDLNEKYEILAFEWERDEEEFKENRRRLKDEAFSWEQKLLTLLMADPYLPKELLPKPWYRDEAQEIYQKKIKTILKR